jgi:zinc transporter 2
MEDKINNNQIDQEADIPYRKISDDNEDDIEGENDVALRKLWTVSVVCLGFMIIEVIGGYIANSIAIMSDAAHLFSDLLGFIISIVSIYIAKRTATHHMSYGFHRAEVIGALVSVTIIWGLTVWLLYEAIYRVFNPVKVNGGIMLIVAILGLLFNVIMGIILAYEGIDHGMNNHSHGEEEGHGAHSDNEKHDHEHDSEHEHEHHHDDAKKTLLEKDSHSHEHDHGHEHEHEHSDNHAHNKVDHGHSHDEHGHEHGGKSQNVNIRAALIHVIGDAIQNIGVIISGAIIYIYPNLMIFDPICTFFFAIVVFLTTTRILKDCVSVIMEGSPIDNVEKLKQRLLKVEGVTDVHDLHVWSLSMGKVSMTCHLKSSSPQKSLIKAKELMIKKYQITHTTIQVEDEDHPENCTQTLH